MDLYIVRHAESAANAQDVLASRLDFPLSPKGRGDARLVAERFRLRGWAYDAIVSSPLLRAQQTARPFAEMAGVPVETHPDLIEQHLGAYSGMNYRQAESDPQYEKDRARRWQWVPRGGGESYSMIASRIHRFFDWVDTRPSSQTLMVFTHAVAMRLIRGVLEHTLPSYPGHLAVNMEVWKVDYKGMGQPHVIESILLLDEHLSHGE